MCTVPGRGRITALIDTSRLSASCEISHTGLMSCASGAAARTDPAKDPASTTTSAVSERFTI
jgi:hypothetical protein